MKRAVLLTIFLIVVFLAAGCNSSVLLGGTQEIIISEVVSSNSGSLAVTNLDSPDWIELYNTTDNAIQLEGYTLSRSDMQAASYTFESGVIEAGQYFVTVAANTMDGQTFEYPCLGFKLPKEGTDLVLKDPEGAVVTKISVPPLDSDISWCFGENGYYYCMTATPGKENGGLLFKTANEIYEMNYKAQGIVINEANRRFIELYNSGKKTVQLAYFALSDDAGELIKWRLPYYELESGEYFVARFDGTGEYNAPFSISQDEGYVYLTLNGEEYDYANLTLVGEGMSTGLNNDGEKVFFIEATPGEVNSEIYAAVKPIDIMSEDAFLRINEVMLDNENCLVDNDGDRSAWAELYNSSSQTVKLNRYFLSDDANDMLKWRLPDIELEGGAYTIIYLSGKDKEMHTSFRVSDGEPVILTDFSQFEQQTVMFADESRLPNISYGEQNGKWLFFSKATPGKENNTHGSESISNADKLDRNNVFISEVSAAKAARSTEKDWIELYNPSDETIELEGLYLSNDLSQLDMFALSGKVNALEYKVVYAGGGASGDAPFGISQAGETIYISDGNCVVDVYQTGALRYGCTSGRANDDFSGERVFFDKPTKGSRNAEPLGGQLNAPDFSEKGGMKNREFSLVLSGEGNIYYTTDGSTPDEHSRLYSNPITVSKTTVITAICMSEGRLSSDAVSVTYLFETPHLLPVMCLSADPTDFSRVYAVNEWSSNKANIVERKCYIEYYEADGTLGTSFSAGFRVSGNSTRVYPQKSLGIYLRSGYGQTSVVYPFFDNYPITEFGALVLRNAGQNFDDSRLSDAYANMLFSNLNIDCAQTKFVVLYINGKYWGLYDLKENQNEDCFAAQHGVDADNVNVIRRNTLAIAGSNSQIKQVYEYAKTWNLANEAQYEKFCEYVDVDAWIDYIIARSYCGDGDMFNQKLWNAADYSVKWRPVFYDCDFSFDSRTGNTLREFFTGEGFTTPNGTKTNMYIPTALKKNKGWCEKFVERYAQVLDEYYEYSLELYDLMAAQIRPEMQRHVNRWGIMSYSEWESEVKRQREIIEARPKNIARQIQKEFNVSTERMEDLFPDFY